MTKLTKEQKYELYLSILDKYKLAQFDEQINNNDYLVCVNCEFFNEFENIAQTVFDCVSELNSHSRELEDFFVFSRECVNDEFNDTIVIQSAFRLIDNVLDCAVDENDLHVSIKYWVEEPYDD